MKNYLLALIMLLILSRLSAQSLESIQMNELANMITLEEINDELYISSAFEDINNFTNLNDAKLEAVQSACNRALKYEYGDEYKNMILDLTVEMSNTEIYDCFLNISESYSKGIVLEKTIVNEQYYQVDNNLKYYVEVRVKVGELKGKRDENFRISASLNRDNYRVGEGISIQVKASKECYLYIFNICSNDTVYILFPNKYEQSNYLAFGDTLFIPSRQYSNDSFRAYLPSDMTESMEYVKIVALKEKINLILPTETSNYGSHKTALVNFSNWLITVDLDNFTEINLPFRIFE